jgi:hypothetical protein
MPARARHPWSGVLLLGLLILALAACGRIERTGGLGLQPVPDDGFTVTLTTDPAPPVVGPNMLTIALLDADGHPVEGAEIEVIGNMTHAGMIPSVGILRGAASGDYRIALDFTMAGDWIIDITLSPPAGKEIVRHLPLRIS